MPLKISTNNVPRDVINAWELNVDERAEFDYIDWEAVERLEASAEFFRYRGDLYDLHEFMHTGDLPQTSELRAWDGYQSDSFFSGIVIRWPRDGREIDFEAVIVGRYCT